MAGAGRRQQEPERVRILYLAANPETTAKLALGREVREIVDRLRCALHRDAIDFVPCWAVRVEDLTHALLEVRPHVIHFSGHGTRGEEIILENETSGAHRVQTGALADLIITLKDNIRVIVFSACHSEALAGTLASQIDCAVGMRDAIDDASAIAFSAAFYQAIGFGRSIDVAFKLGLGAMRMHGLCGAHVPTLVTRDGVKPSEIVLVSDRPRASLPTRLRKVGERVPQGGRVHESIAGDWSVEIRGYQGFARVSAQLHIDSTGGIKGRLSGAVEALFVEGRWCRIDGDQMEIRGLLFMSGCCRLMIYAAHIRFSSIMRDVMLGETLAGEKMCWRRCEPREDQAQQFPSG